MARALFVCASFLFVLAAPAEGFVSCSYSAATHEVTAVFGTATTGTLSQSGTQIRADGVQCDGAATTANTDKIKVVGDDDDETLTIDLAGGSFPGGFTGEGTTDDEVEIEVDLGTNATSASQPFELVVLGTPGVENVVVGLDGTFGSFFTAVNLNANESDGVDADVTFTRRVLAEVRGLGGQDVLSAAGGAGTGFETDAATTMLRGGPGDDDLGYGAVEPGPGDDTIRSNNATLTRVFYTDAPSAVTVTRQSGAPGPFGGATDDGQVPPGVDVFVDGPPDGIDGSENSGDVLTGSEFGGFLRGNDGDDTINGGGGDESLLGGDGADTIHGGLGVDGIGGGDGTDLLYGDGEGDNLDGGPGNDTVSGGEGDDRLRQDSYFGLPGEEESPDGADDLSGGPGIDTVMYGDPSLPGPFGRLAPVTVDLDDVADDGASGEGDNVRSDVENIVGGLAGDTLTGDADDNVIAGYDGPDTIDGGAGSDDVFGGAGDDTIEARDDFADTVECGAGTDGGRRDATDSLNADCENVALPVDMPADPPIVPPTTPPAEPPAPPPATPPTTPPVVIPPGAAPPISQLITLPSARRCASRRRFRVRVRSAIRGTVRRVTIFINGRRVKTVTGTRIGLPIDLRGLPKGRIRVRLRVELTDGRVATDTRTYRTCATKRRRGRFG